MRLFLKIVFVSFFFLLSSQSFAWTNDYVSVFKPVKKVKTTVNLQKSLKEDAVQVRSIMSVQKKKIIGLMKPDDNTKHKQVSTTDI